MDAVEALERLGGLGTRAQIVAASSRGQLESALRRDLIVKVARGRYALPTADEAHRAAHELKGTAVLLSAAAHWGWSMKHSPDRPHIAVVRGRRLTPEQRKVARITWVKLPRTDVDGWVTTPVRTVLDCAARLPFDEALAVADSALRTRRVTKNGLRLAALKLPVRGGRARVLRVIEAADGRAANPFESVLRAIALDVEGLSVEPQVVIHRGDKWVGRVDLADERLKIVIEADSHEFHGEREMFEKDCVRYDELVADGWLVIRFPWTQVMWKQAWVREIIEAVVAIRLGSRAAAA
ncbi:DUF559 domain-containing protein [Knoellia koreensis]|uniref:DUF559 domain-containing protein n=1 Tax=Knoellia koreensis TaxID=2730921 RepID=A0A849HGJ8_9MICO|nr:DUF559 domain-containing protein [Knoellia sp. DB2414S]NNM45763.1 DUF559 domain-containing protein [Knoellia sp. DB2414S]